MSPRPSTAHLRRPAILNAAAEVISERGVQKHVTSIFDKLGIPAGTDDHRRVLAVLTFLRA